MLNIHSFFLDRTFVSPIKVGLMSIAPIIIIAYAPYVTKAVIWGLTYWLYCIFSSYLNAALRFSTLAYSGLFIITFIMYYNLFYQGTLPIHLYKKVFKYIICFFAIILLMQQFCLLVGIRNFPLINLIGNSYMDIDKLPSMTLEPSHTAVIMSFAFLCYIRCNQLMMHQKISFSELFNKDNRWTTLAFLWVMLTMGSASAYFGIIGLSLYFASSKNIVTYLIVALICAVSVTYLAQHNEQLDRVTKLSKAMSSGDSASIIEADGSGASRIIPLINTFTKLDLSKKETWFGHGNESQDSRYYKESWLDWSKADYFVIPIVRQYGLIGWFLTLILVYSCCIKRFFSIETLLWFTLGMATLGNIYFHWGIILMMTGIRYYQSIEIDDTLCFEESTDNYNEIEVCENKTES